MSIFGIRKKAKEALKSILGFEEGEAAYTAAPTVQVQEEVIKQPSPSTQMEQEVEQDPEKKKDSIRLVKGEQKNAKVETAEARMVPEPTSAPEPVGSADVAEVSSDAEGIASDEGLPLTIENVQEVFDDYIRPGLQSDGGDITLIKIEDNDIYVKLVGACSTCPSSVMTMKMGVEALLQEEFPSMRELIDITAEEGA